MGLLLLCRPSDTFRDVVKKLELELQALKVLTKIGIREGQVVLDFGCGPGTYTIPAAKIVGEQGRVYALDKDGKALDELMQKAKSVGLKNIERIDTSGELKCGLADESIDSILLFDVFHHYYFPQMDERKRLLEEIYRILKSDGFISVWPKHMESEAEDEIKNANFYLERESSEMLIHDNKDRERGEILNFKKGK
jgi:ubiquinone/menaquinone biosynthesis C-methylase UbiE